MGIREATQDEIASLTKGQEKAEAGGFDVIEFATGLARSMGQGVTFGFADEAEAYVTSILGDEGYKQARDRIRGELSEFRKEYPKTAYGTEIAASVAMPMGVAGLAGRGVGAGARVLNPEAAQFISQAAQQAATKLPKAITGTTAKAAGMGGLYGVGAAEEAADAPTAAATSAALGAGLQKALPPVAKGAVELAKRGVPLTVGQKFGGIVGGIEERVAGLPVADFLVGGARRRAVEKFGTVAFNEALEPIGAKIPMKLTGRDAYIAAEKAINKAYDDALKGVSVPAPQRLMDDVASFVGDLPAKEADQFAKMINRELSSRVDEAGNLSGEAFKQAQSAIRKQAYTFSTSTDAYQRQLGDALSDAAEELTAALAKANPDKAGKLSNVDTAFSRFKPLQMAAAQKTQAEAITPAKLRDMVYRQSRRSPAVLARGEGRMQELAETGVDVLGAKVPDSGTAGRTLVGAGLLSGGAYFDPVTTGLVAGGLGAAYTRPAQSLIGGAMEAIRRGGRSPAAAGILGSEATDRIVDSYTTQSGAIYDITESGKAILRGQR